MTTPVAISFSAVRELEPTVLAISLQELKDMEQVGVKFSDEDILRIFGRNPREGE